MKKLSFTSLHHLTNGLQSQAADWNGLPDAQIVKRQITVAKIYQLRLIRLLWAVVLTVKL